MKHVVGVLIVLAFIQTMQCDQKKELSTGPVFYFVRHGQTDWNMQELRQGHAGLSLNECGRQQARDLKARWNGISFDACFSSDLQRTFATASIFTSRDLFSDTSSDVSLGLSSELSGRVFEKMEAQEGDLAKGRFISACSIEDIAKDVRLRDRNYGVLEGVSMEEYNSASLEQWATIESHDEFSGRVTAFLNEVQVSTSSLQSGNVLVVTHGGVMRILLDILFNNPLTPNDNGVAVNTGFFKTRFSGTEWVVEEMQGITLPTMSERVVTSVLN